MAYAHTNSKGTTYYLHSKGKMFFFSREVKEGALEAVPAGYTVVEMKTGMLALKKVQAEGTAAEASSEVQA
jgi:N-acetyl-beta-hexosaminidase